MHLKTPRAKVPYASARGLCFGANGKEEDPLPKTPVDSQMMRRRRCVALWSSELMARDRLHDGARCQAVEQTGDAARRSAPRATLAKREKCGPEKMRAANCRLHAWRASAASEPPSTERRTPREPAHRRAPLHRGSRRRRRPPPRLPRASERSEAKKYGP